MTSALLEPALEAGQFQLIEDLCEPLPIVVMCELIGVPQPDHGDFDRWISDLGLMFSASMTLETRRIAEDAMANLSGAISDLVESRREAGDPGDDLLGDLIAVEDGGDRLSREELVAMIVNLLFGALDTTRGAAFDGACLPGAARRCVGDPARGPRPTPPPRRDHAPPRREPARTSSP